MLVKYLTGTQKQYEDALKKGSIVPTYFYYIDRKNLYLGTVKLSNKEDIILAIDELKKSNYFATTAELEQVKNILFNYYTKKDIDIFLQNIQNNFNISIEELNIKKLDKTGGTITGNLSIQGDLSVAGEVHSKDVETLLVEDNIIVANSKGVNIDTDLSGFVIRKDKSVAYGIMYDNTRNGVAVGEGRLDENNKFTYGHYDAEGNFIEDLHEGQLLATRKEDIINNRIVVWDAENYTLKDGGCGVYDILGRIDVADAAVAAVSKKVEKKQDKLTFDSTPTAGSNNPVTSDGIKKAIDNIEVGGGVDLPISKGSGGYGAFQQNNDNNASGAGSVALGANTTSAGNYGFTRGGHTKNTGTYGEAAGNRCQNFATDGYCGGDSSRNMAVAGFVHGSYLNTDGTFEEGMENSDLNKAIPNGQAVFGSLNARNNNALMIVGNGVGNDSTSPLYGRHNAFEVLKDGRATVQKGPVEDKDIVNKKYLDDQIASLKTQEECPLSLSFGGGAYSSPVTVSVSGSYFPGVDYCSVNGGEKIRFSEYSSIQTNGVETGMLTTSASVSLYGVKTVTGVYSIDQFVTVTGLYPQSKYFHLSHLEEINPTSSIDFLLSYIGINTVIETIKSDTFKNRTSLKTFRVNTNIIETRAFQGCVNLTEVTFGDRLEKLYGAAFEGCSSLKTITINALTPPILYDSSVLNNLTALQYIKVPVGAQEFYKKEWSSLASKIVSDLDFNYVKKTELNDTLENYYTKDQIDTQNESFAKITENNTFTGENHFKDIVVEGNIIQQGEAYETHAEKVLTKDDYIIMREGAAAGLGEGEYTGFQATKYDGENDGRLVFDNTGTARVGDVGNEQALATRAEAAELVDKSVMVWDAVTYKMVGGGLLSDYQKIHDDTLETDCKTIPEAINELRQNVIWNRTSSFYKYAQTISINYSNVRSYFKFYQNDSFKILVLSGAEYDEHNINQVNVADKIFDLTPLLQQISDREVGTYLDIIINGVDATPMKCIIKKETSNNFTNPINLTFQSSLGFAKPVIVRNLDNTFTTASSITLSGTAKNYTEFDINGAVTCCYFSN